MVCVHLMYGVVSMTTGRQLQSGFGGRMPQGMRGNLPNVPNVQNVPNVPAFGTGSLYVYTCTLYILYMYI